ncbi:topology modulation protein [Gracilibacillus dipsosauri]|uniref:Topology modulation protein n=1 Tax=Gracilibacillus dipsosauri TaxID=178340 RepID=A0A317L8B2_9BACI|nr:topology modulation protein [Gracilibacillus dipsosauri]PWU70039.1 topology modulation protein [Gracilibacillus dipsosauri]
MNRIMVIGISPGVGKSTFARRLGNILNLKVYHLDAYYWKPNWIEAPYEEFANAQKEIVKKSQWIIEGNYNKTFDIRAEHADTIIYLELPLRVCLYRVVKRWLTNIGKNRPDMGDGCTEKLDWPFIKYICTTYYPRKKKMHQRFQDFQRIAPEKEIIILNTKKDMKQYLEEIN